MTILPSKEQKEHYVREMFDSIAAKYDFVNSLMSLGMDHRWRRFAVHRAEIRPGGVALDICCGTGKITLELARRVGLEGRVTGLDFSPRMLEVARQAVAASEFKEIINLIQGNALCLPFEDNSFDAVTVGWGLRNVPDIFTVVQEMMRVVRPGGMVVSLDMAKPELPVFKQAYWLYFEKIIPLLGKIGAHKETAYQYLHQSARVFPHQKELARLFHEAGLEAACYHNLCGGVVAVVEGRKTRIR
ncbi:demethylmenaquinone methyltransferase [Candidatus Formimonas warabiya]|uniref:Demethylmenaquinone methyltransferase n=1 Tax=Formimonas warabiya TaxID=1761012 RepID=A0A3G1KMZ8_FORW1|nr:demethylmenaquinone methyltransferase [Candidatus Formimonas warabiya]ATW23862.1 bifunctional demethylmenaquinone methyltransferase/2-methoxy-6-polyprenyl-1,4-benzoquinol methylase [Candidatus Formimonas warabiya]